MKKLYLYGAGSGSREVLLLIQRINAVSPEWEVMGFVDEDPAIVGTYVDDLKVFGPDDVPSTKNTYGICGIMDPYVRQRMIEQHIEGRDLQLPTVIAPDVIVPGDFAAGPGTIIMPTTTISFDVQLGKGVFALWGSVLGHHLRAGEYATILSFASITGECRIGARSTIGAGAILNNKVTVGADAFVGIGSTVLRDVGDHKQVVSLPRQIESDRR